MGIPKLSLVLPMKYRLLLLGVAFLLSVWAIWWLYEPPYLDLYAPVPSYHGHIWNSSSRSTFSYAGRPGVEYLLRRDGTAYTEVVGWKNAAEGLSYFDRWLGEHGWERTEMFSSGDPILPETGFLKFGETFAVYTRSEDLNSGRRGLTGRVTVAVWPIGEAGETCDCVSGFNVVIVTASPSLWREFTDGFD